MIPLSRLFHSNGEILPSLKHANPPNRRHIIHAAKMNSSFEQTLIEVWRQVLVENGKVVELGTERYPVRRTPKRGLRQVDFMFDGNEIRGLEQNPATNSRWSQMARSGKKVMQFLSEVATLQTSLMGR